MIRYVTKSERCEGPYGETAWTADFVYEAERCPIDTGLVDHLGRPLYRINDRDPIGFRVK